MIIFFGTCELTNKNGRFITIPENLESRIEQVIDTYKHYKQRILDCNPDSTVIFLDCQYFSIIVWNFLKKHPCPGIFEQQQKRLEEGILIFNRKLKDLNSDRAVPRLALDFMYFIKKR